MTRIFGAYAYSDGPRSGCWWDETCDLPATPTLDHDAQCDVAVIGGGFTGLSTALHLAEAGQSVIVLEAAQIGWGASGRNGGFCCLGGGMLGDQAIDRKFGRTARLEFRRAEASAVRAVSDLIDRFDGDVDRHSDGETELAHRPSDFAGLEAHARTVRENYGVEPILLDASELRQHGFGSGFFGALTIPIGFGLNPRKYLALLLQAAQDAGVRVYARSGVTDLKEGWLLTVGRACVTAKQVVIATNGYSSENLPPWLAGRYMPAQSNVLVTRPLSADELASQGWTSTQMAYDTRNLLHYFRLMPDGRFLFGMRGGLRSTPGAESRARATTRRHFDRMFPAWQHVEAEHSWSGMVALARNRLPFVGAVPGASGLWAALCYHGNGVAMGTYAGQLLAKAIASRAETPFAMATPAVRFPMGRLRRILMPPIYAAMNLADRWR